MTLVEYTETSASGNHLGKRYIRSGNVLHGDPGLHVGTKAVLKRLTERTVTIREIVIGKVEVYLSIGLGQEHGLVRPLKKTMKLGAIGCHREHQRSTDCAKRLRGSIYAHATDGGKTANADKRWDVVTKILASLVDSDGTYIVNEINMQFIHAFADENSHARNCIPIII